jgi:hypothetical protein
VSPRRRGGRCNVMTKAQSEVAGEIGSRASPAACARRADVAPHQHGTSAAPPTCSCAARRATPRISCAADARCRFTGSASAATCWCATAACAASSSPRRAQALELRNPAASSTARPACRARGTGPAVRPLGQLGPADFFAGIPGSVGGALAMNAGAFGGETWNSVVEVDVLDRRGHGPHAPGAEYQVGYRHVQKPADEWFLCRAHAVQPRYQAAEARMRALLGAAQGRPSRSAEWSCGSVFTNPPGDHAARLIEAAGLKGPADRRRAWSRPSTRISSSTTGGATAADIEALIAQVQPRSRVGMACVSCRKCRSSGSRQLRLKRRGLEHGADPHLTSRRLRRSPC